MSDKIKEYTLLKAKVEKIKSKADKAAGALKQNLDRIKKEFGCSSLKEAEKLLDNLRRDLTKLTATYEKELKKFESLYGNSLK